MFRRKDEDTQEELDGMNTDTNTKDNAQRQGNFQQPKPQAADGQGRQPAGRAPAPAASAPSYRPQPQSNQAPRSVVPQAATSQAQQADARQTTAGAKGSKRVLTVGNDILLKGEIATCDRLVIEGMVDATLKDVHTVEISGTGSFKGTAQIEDAEISGLFEGDLIVKNRLTIYSTGKVRGRISYGEIEIERGGEMSGEIKFGATDFDEKSSKDNKEKPKKDAA